MATPTPGEFLEALADDLAADDDIDVTSWTDLDGLPADMDVIAAQWAEIVDHACEWICQRAGFEPSPVCLLRPLAGSMDWLRELFTTVDRWCVAEWADLREGVVETSADLRSVDRMVADAMPVVA
jgi:hypothetical protein